MRLLRNLFPQTLVGRVSALYLANLLLFVGAGLGVFYQYQFTNQIEQGAEAAQVLSEVVAQTVGDSVVIGDYDTVERTLHKAIRRSPFADASFIDLQGGVITAVQTGASFERPPDWLTERVADQLHDINNNIAIGGRDYGVLRLRFAPQLIAGEIWTVTTLALWIAAAALFLGLVLFRVLMSRWLVGLGRIQQMEPGGPPAIADPGDAMTLRAPLEIRAAIDAFRRTGTELRVQRETAAVTLAAIADGVLTTDAQGRILYANPAAERMLQAGSGTLLRRHVRQALPGAFGEPGGPDPLAAWSGKRLDLDGGADGRIVLDATFSPIAGSADETIGHVLVCRDVTAAQRYENRLRRELETRQAALHDLRGALQRMLPEASTGRFEVSGDDLGAVSRLVAQLVRERETSRRALAEARERELATGHEIQRALLIGDLPAEARVAEVASYTEPSQGIDGDFVAFTTFRTNCLELLVGDVMGKGIPAALIGAAVRTAYNQVVSELLAASFGSRELPSPAEILNALHRKLTPRLIELEAFVTMALYRFDFDFGSGTMRYVNAGHTAGLLVRAGGGIDRVLGDNLPVGVLAEERYMEKSEVVAAGDALIVYSDGVTEARNADGVEFGEERLHDFIARTNGCGLPANIRMQALRRAVRDFAGERGMLDDRTAVMVTLRAPGDDDAGPPGPGRGEETFDLPWQAARLEPLRRRVATAAAFLGTDAANGLVLAAFEAATNVVRHVPPPFHDATLSCRVRRDAAQVSVEIWYLGEPFRPATEPAPDFSGDSDGGFGLYIMSQAVDRVAHESPLPGICCTRLTQSGARTAGA